MRILTETENALTRQYSALMATEKVTVDFTEDGIAALARIAAEVNRAVENIGARRLHTVMERVFEDLSFTAPDRSGDAVTVDAAFVEAHLGELSPLGRPQPLRALSRGAAKAASATRVRLPVRQSTKNATSTPCPARTDATAEALAANTLTSSRGTRGGPRRFRWRRGCRFRCPRGRRRPRPVRGRNGRRSPRMPFP